MNWDDVRVLRVLLEVRNLQQASSRLGVDRSTVSRRLAELERRLGTSLFSRTRDGVRPTEAAERLRPLAERMAVDARELELAARSGGERATGVVRLATTEPLASVMLEQGLLTVREQHPGLELELLTGNAPVDLLRGEADLAVRVSTPRMASLRARRIARMKVGLYAAPGYLTRRGRPRAADQLREHDVVVPSGELHRLPEGRWLQGRPGVRVTFRSNSVAALAAAAAAGAGIVALSTPLGDPDRRLERLFVLEREVPVRPVWLVMPPADRTRTAVRIVADRIAADFARS